MTAFTGLFDKERLTRNINEQAATFAGGAPFPHIVIDDFLPSSHLATLADQFPPIDSPVWLDWRKRSGHQYGKQGPGDASRFDLLAPSFHLALLTFNSAPFLDFLEAMTGISKLLPDPHFVGGGMHQIVAGGILDIHTDFNYYDRLGIYRRLNVLLYLTERWEEGYGGELELWDGGKDTGKHVKKIAPLKNRLVIFKTDKRSFHGHPAPWRAPAPVTRRSIALYYYTAAPEAGEAYDAVTDFQGVAFRSTQDDAAAA